MTRRSFTILALTLGAASGALGQTFIPGNQLFIRVGSGGANVLDPSGINNNQTFFDVTKASSGQSFTRFTNTATTNIAHNGVDPLGGQITRSPNGLMVAIAGYAAPAAALGTDIGTVPSATTQRRIWLMGFQGGLANLPPAGIASSNQLWNLGAAYANSVPIRSGFSTHGGDLYASNDLVGGSAATLFPINGSTVTGGSVSAAAGIRHMNTFGGNVFYSTAAGIFRIPLLTAPGTPTPVQVATGTNLAQFFIIDGQRMVAADLTNGLQRYVIGGADNWNTVGTPVAPTSMDATAVPIQGVSSDGINVFTTTVPAVATAGNNTAQTRRFADTGTTTPVTTFTAGANFVYRGSTLSPEPSAINMAPTGTANQVRFAMRHMGTATDPFLRSIRIGTMSFASHRTAATLATVGYKGHIADMTVDRNGNTLLLNISPNATQSGWTYSIIRVSADGSSVDEGPLASGAPGQAAPAGFLPVQIRANPNSDEAAVLMWSTAANTARLGIVTLPAAIGGGVTTVADWGPYTSAQNAANRAVNLAYSRTLGLPRILFSNYGTPTAGQGIYEILTATAAATSTVWRTESTGTAGFRAIGMTFDGTDNARVLMSGGHNWFISSGSAGLPQRYRVDTVATTGITASSASYIQDNTVTNPVTALPIWNQHMPNAIHWDNAGGASVVHMIGLSGTLVPNVLATEPRTNILGGFRAWRMDGTTNNVNQASYRFFPGINLN